MADEKRPEGWHNAQLDFAKTMSYADYLHLDALLNAQHPQTQMACITLLI